MFYIISVFLGGMLSATPMEMVKTGLYRTANPPPYIAALAGNEKDAACYAQALLEYRPEIFDPVVNNLWKNDTSITQFTISTVYKYMQPTSGRLINGFMVQNIHKATGESYNTFVVGDDFSALKGRLDAILTQFRKGYHDAFPSVTTAAKSSSVLTPANTSATSVTTPGPNKGQQDHLFGRQEALSAVSVPPRQQDLTPTSSQGNPKTATTSQASRVEAHAPQGLLSMPKAYLLPPSRDTKTTMESQPREKLERIEKICQEIADTIRFYRPNTKVETAKKFLARFPENKKEGTKPHVGGDSYDKLEGEIEMIKLAKKLHPSGAEYDAMFNYPWSEREKNSGVEPALQWFKVAAEATRLYEEAEKEVNEEKNASPRLTATTTTPIPAPSAATTTKLQENVDLPTIKETCQEIADIIRYYYAKKSSFITYRDFLSKFPTNKTETSQQYVRDEKSGQEILVNKIISLGGEYNKMLAYPPENTAHQGGKPPNLTWYRIALEATRLYEEAVQFKNEEETFENLTQGIAELTKVEKNKKLAALRMAREDKRKRVTSIDKRISEVEKEGVPQQVDQIIKKHPLEIKVEALGIIGQKLSNMMQRYGCFPKVAGFTPASTRTWEEDNPYDPDDRDASDKDKIIPFNKAADEINLLIAPFDKEFGSNWKGGKWDEEQMVERFEKLYQKTMQEFTTKGEEIKKYDDDQKRALEQKWEQFNQEAATKRANNKETIENLKQKLIQAKKIANFWIKNVVEFTRTNDDPSFSATDAKIPLYTL
jgi:hypothetical protein